MNIAELKTFLNTPSLEIKVSIDKIENSTPYPTNSKNGVNTFLVIGIIVLTSIIAYSYITKNDLIEKEDKIS